MKIPPGVFHPGFFTSTRLLLNHLLEFPLQGKRLLELGAGSGLISMVAAQKGARVLATDINPLVIKYLAINSVRNSIGIEIRQSDLFSDIPSQTFDLIAINPPYYKKDPVSDAEKAWYCGANGEYFVQLFAQLGDYCHSGTKVFLVLCDGCDLQMIREAAMENGWTAELQKTKPTLIERNFIYILNRIVA
jgi:release factor glutamine methyltransferase